MPDYFKIKQKIENYLESHGIDHITVKRYINDVLEEENWSIAEIAAGITEHLADE